MHFTSRRLTRCSLVAVAFLVAGGAGRASAELAFFASGRTMSIQSHQFVGNQVVLVLRDGGQITCDRSVIRTFKPDEIPYPSAVPAPAAAAAAAPSAATAGRWTTIVDQVAAKQGLDPRLVQAVIAVESAGAVDARSPKGAMGLMQLMPGTARRYHVTDPYDPRANIEAGVRRLKQLLARYPLRLALAAYNAGEAAVARYGGMPPFPETQAYVAKVLARLGR